MVLGIDLAYPINNARQKCFTLTIAIEHNNPPTIAVTPSSKGTFEPSLLANII